MRYPAVFLSEQGIAVRLRRSYFTIELQFFNNLCVFVYIACGGYYNLYMGLLTLIVDTAFF